MEKSIEEKDSGARFEECMERVLGLRQADAREYSPPHARLYRRQYL